MHVAAVRNVSHGRRQRWVFTLAPTSLREDGITLILSEYALEIREGVTWRRPKTLWYKRRPTPGAGMVLEMVPPVDDETRQLLVQDLARKVAFTHQSGHGLTPA